LAAIESTHAKSLVLSLRIHAGGFGTKNPPDGSENLMLSACAPTRSPLIVPPSRFSAHMAREQGIETPKVERTLFARDEAAKLAECSLWLCASENGRSARTRRSAVPMEW
jgi:hypothetical protein